MEYSTKSFSTKGVTMECSTKSFSTKGVTMTTSTGHGGLSKIAKQDEHLGNYTKDAWTSEGINLTL